MRDNNILTPKGFTAASVACGLKPDGKKDLALIASELPCQVAGVFTTNKVKAAPVLHDQQIIRAGKAVRGVVMNAGNANACNGDAGMQHAEQTAQAAAAHVGAETGEMLVLSTGVIGVPLPVEKLLDGISQMAGAGTAEAWMDAAQAIMTTDTRPKIISVQSPSGYTITGIAKGAGMISPNMATMLSVVATDAALTPEMLAQVPDVWGETFNRIVVDGDMSTNDTVLLLANGASGVTVDAESNFADLLYQVCVYLAKAIVQDGEGATKLVTVSVHGAASQPDAEKIARAIATSPLCKTAFYGADPNWGRIVCAAGYAQAEFLPEESRLFLQNGQEKILLFENGQGAAYDEAAAIALMQTDVWEVSLALGQGTHSFWVWTCDLSHEYVTINGHYRT